MTLDLDPETSANTCHLSLQRKLLKGKAALVRNVPAIINPQEFRKNHICIARKQMSSPV